jgi:predicted ribosomally synthesized peptide with SipW-like signal peptide
LPDSSPKRGERRGEEEMISKKILASIVVIGILALAMGWGTYSWFTDTETSSSNTFTAGTLDVGLQELETTEITISNMAPGDLTGDWVINITNTGTLNLAWFGDLVITGGVKLREAIYIDYAQMEFLKPDGTSWEQTDNFIKEGRGSGSYPDWYNYLADLSPFHVVTLKNFDDNEGMCPGTPYEFMGALKPGYKYRLTLRFGFAPGAGNEYQGNVVNPITINFKVDATQINAAALEALHPTLSNHLGWLEAQIAKQT